MQVKSLKQTSNAIEHIQNAFYKLQFFKGADSEKETNIKLQNAMSQYSDDTIKSAVNQGHFTESQTQTLLNIRGLSVEQSQAALSVSALAASENAAASAIATEISASQMSAQAATSNANAKLLNTQATQQQIFKDQEHTSSTLKNAQALNAYNGAVISNSNTKLLNAQATQQQIFKDQEHTSSTLKNAQALNAYNGAVISNSNAKLFDAQTTAQMNAAENANIAVKTQHLAATEINSDAELKSLLTKTSIITETELENGKTVKITSSKLKEAIATGQLTQQEAELIAVRLNNGIAAQKENAAIIASSNAAYSGSKSWSAYNSALDKVSGFAATALGKITLLAAAVGVCYTAYKGIDLVQKWATGESAINKYNKALENSSQKIEENKSTLSGYQSEIDSNNSRIEELQQLYNNGTITEAQKAELTNLQYQNALLDEKIEKLQQVNNEETKKQAETAADKFNTEFGGNAEDIINRNFKDSDNSMTKMLDGNQNNSDSYKLSTLKKATDEYNQAVQNLSQNIEGTTQEDVKNAAEALDMAKEDFSGVSDSLWNSLQDEKAKLEAVRGTDAFDETTYNNIISWENIFKNYVEEYKNAAQKAQDEADKNPIIQSVEFDDPSGLLTESDDKSQTATLADLQSEADLLSIIQKELESTGKIGVSSMQSIVKQYPEAKKALSDYMQGIISEQQLFDELQTIYQNDADAYIRHLVAESQKDVEFFNCLKANYPELFNELSTIYGDDVKNWTTAAQAKAEVTKNLVTAMSTAWGNYFMALGNAESGFTLAETSTFDDSEIYDHTLAEEENIFTATHKNVTSAYFINWLKALKCRTYVLLNSHAPHKI